jgi:hypothetical protein
MVDLVGMCCGCDIWMHMGGGGHHASDYPRVGPCVEEDPFPGWLRGFPDCFAVHTVRIRSGSTEQAV